MWLPFAVSEWWGLVPRGGLVEGTHWKWWWDRMSTSANRESSLWATLNLRARKSGEVRCQV